MKKTLPQIIILHKKEGETPLQALGVFRRKRKMYTGVKMTYAGRLDPMASGVLLVLAGNEVKNKEKYLKLNKEYEFDILFGFATDTYDILGKVQHSHIIKNAGMLEKDIKNNLKYFKGKFLQKYPAYSSKTWEKARTGERFEREGREINVKSIKFFGVKKMRQEELLQNIQKRIAKVSGDFRQKEILKIWSKNLQKGAGVFYIGKFKIRCGSGTYVRGLADSLGEKIGIPALAYSIKRTKIGKWGKI